MKRFHCHICDQQIFFDNAQCLRCGSPLGFLPQALSLSALERANDGRWLAGDGQLYRRCTNGAQWQVCNWMVPAESEAAFCTSCNLNETIPDLSIDGNLEYWRRLEQGKRRLVYSLMRLQLPMPCKNEDPVNGLAFEFLRASDGPDADDDYVMTGHSNGKVTVNVAEADDLERERIRLNLNEVYRSVLGHFRHESGHYYWWQLISGKPMVSHFRELFGDEREKYDAAIKRYYREGPARNWKSRFVSAYASSHPWEDWAECWSHYLTIVDALETAQSFGVSVNDSDSGNLFPRPDSYNTDHFDDLLNEWLPLTYAVNSINRSAGQKDLYPFVLPGPAIDKLRFVHQVVKLAR